MHIVHFIEPLLKIFIWAKKKKKRFHSGDAFRVVCMLLLDWFFLFSLVRWLVFSVYYSNYLFICMALQVTLSSRWRLLKLSCAFSGPQRLLIWAEGDNEKAPDCGTSAVLGRATWWGWWRSEALPPPRRCCPRSSPNPRPPQKATFF